MSSIKDCILYTDGACLDNGTTYARGGVGIYNQTEPELSISLTLDDCIKELGLGVSLKQHTNNIAELCAFIYAIKTFKDRYDKIHIYTDSSYIVNGLNCWITNWKKRNWKNVKNIKYWKMLDELINSNQHITYSHVKREYNTEADRLSRQSI